MCKGCDPTTSRTSVAAGLFSGRFDSKLFTRLCIPGEYVLETGGNLPVVAKGSQVHK